MTDPALVNHNIFSILLYIFAVLFIFKLIKVLFEWRRNQQQPILTVQAHVISKRTKTSRAVHKPHQHVTTDYFATFRIENNEKVLEFLLTSNEFHQLEEGTTGKLTFQGTMFQGFDKEHSRSD